MLSNQSGRSTDDVDSSIMQSISPNQLSFSSIPTSIRSSPSLSFASACYNNARTPFGIHEILGLASASAAVSNSTSQMPLAMVNNFCAAASSPSNRGSISSASTATAAITFENAAATYFIPTSAQPYCHNFLDPSIQNSNLSTASFSTSQLFPLDINSAPFQMHMLDYSTEMNGKLNFINLNKIYFY